MNNTRHYMKALSAVWAALLLPSTANAQCVDGYTRGIGLYPGDSKEWFAPHFKPDNTYRDLSRNRMTTASSSYDYNLTAQLVTDGIVDAAEPNRLIVTTPTGILPKQEREFTIDGGPYSQNVLMGANSFIGYRWTRQQIKANRVVVSCRAVYYADKAKGGYTFKCTTSTRNGKTKTLGVLKGDTLPGRKLKWELPSDPNKQTDREMLPVRNIMVDMPIDANHGIDDLKLHFYMPGAHHWIVTDVKFYNDDEEVADVLPSYHFTSAWMSEAAGRQWLMTDLGAPADIDRVKLHWISKAVEGQIEVSFDGKTWTTAAALPGGSSLTDDVACKAKARYVRLVMTRPLKKNALYALSEMEVMGRGGLSPVAHAPQEMADGKLMLGGGGWMLQRASQVAGTGRQLSLPGASTDGWLPATVPATVLMSYVNAGAVPNTNYDDNINQVSESFFNSDFWYRTTFNVPDSLLQRHTFLCFDGINWKAEVYLNGQQVDNIQGAFTRSRADVTSLLKKGENTLAVKVIKNEHYGSVKEKTAESTGFNGGILGADNPTFHATIGWDWITTIRGRNMGIWNDVYLKNEGDVGVADPLVTTQLAPNDTTVTLGITATVCNNTAHPVSGVLAANVGPVVVAKKLTLGPWQSFDVPLTADEFPQLRNLRMRLWWPNGYGEPYLHEASVVFWHGNEVTDGLAFKVGLRQMTYRDENSRLKLYINNRRFVPLGGNWGFSENNLCYRAREYDIAVNYHRQMNFNTIRNWVGQTGDEEFYQACDRHGIMVWQDFWLANPSDGPDPYDNTLFLNNATDYVRRIRRHPCIALYCGRNEGFPSATLNPALKAKVEALHPGIGYIGSSADEGVSGHGPYRAMPAKYYFEHQTGKLHSERGMPNVMNFESLSRTLAPQHLWPQSRYWGLHDYSLKGAQGGESFNQLVSNAFGQPSSAEEFTERAQWINYDGYRAMYESGSRHRMGLLIWMSHPCWPTMVWQTYDYYFDPNAAFFGSKKACEPLHIQLNAATDSVEVVNLCTPGLGALTAQAAILDINGNLLWRQAHTLTSAEDSTTPCMKLPVGDSLQTGSLRSLGAKDVYYVRLVLKDASGRVLSQNTYVRGREEGNLQALNNLPHVHVDSHTTINGNSAIVQLSNNTRTPALMMRLVLMGADGEQILPVNYSDNYFHLMPGEKKTVNISWSPRDTRGAQPVVVVKGFNYQELVQ